jgi:hypothetical protein
MLAFIADMVTIYGIEIKVIIDKEFVNGVLTKLKSYRIKRFESEIIQYEEILRKAQLI